MYNTKLSYVSPELQTAAKKYLGVDLNADVFYDCIFGPLTQDATLKQLEKDLQRQITKKPLTTQTSSTHTWIAEDKKSSYLEVIIPGVKRETLELSVIDNLLTIDYLDRNQKEASQKFALPKDTCVTGISSKLEDGILTVNFPFIEKVEHKIEVK